MTSQPPTVRPSKTSARWKSAPVKTPRYFFSTWIDQLEIQKGQALWCLSLFVAAIVRGHEAVEAADCLAGRDRPRHGGAGGLEVPGWQTRPGAVQRQPRGGQPAARQRREQRPQV